MFRKDRIGRRGAGVILYIKESIQAYEIKNKKKQIVKKLPGVTQLQETHRYTVGLVYQSPNISSGQGQPSRR